MKFSRFSKSFMAIAAIFLIVPLSVNAAAYDDYDDDIYYNPSKDAEKKKAAQEAARAQKSVSQPVYNNVVIDYDDPADYPLTASGLSVDVDDYNRRGQFLVNDSVAAVSDDSDTYAYTRRIERFYNEDIVNGSNDQSLIDSYYSTPATTDINVYVVNTTPWTYYNSWYNPWSPWAWNSLYWNSWYYTPSWSWGWGWYDPWYSWSWGWGPSWSWGGPGWGWGGPGWHHPGPGPAPGWNRPGFSGHWASNSAGASRPHSPVGVGPSATTSTRRPGAFSAGANTAVTRPGNSGQATNHQAIGAVRPGSAQQATSRPGNVGASTINRPSATAPSTTPTTTVNRGRNSSSSSSVSVPRSNSNTNTRSSGSSFGSGSRSSGGFSGGSHGGGSGGTRGRR